MIVQIPNQLFNDLFFSLAQHDVIKENKSGIYQVFDDFIVDLLLSMLLLPSAQNIKGELFGVISNRYLLRLGKNVRNSHQSNRSVLQRLSFIANYVFQTVQKLEIFDALNDVSTRRKIQNGDKNCQKRNFSLTASRFEPQYFDDALYAAVRDELVPEIGRI